jgi:hypothetical protein
LPGEVVDGGGVGAGGGRRVAVAGRGSGKAGQAGAQEPVVQPGEEQGVREAGAGDLVAEAVRDAFDEPVLAQAPQVIGHLPRGDGLGRHAEELRQDGAQVAVGESAGKEPEHAQGCEQGLDAGIAQVHARYAGAGGGQGLVSWATAAWPSAGWWLSFSTASMRRVAVKPAARSAGRLTSRPTGSDGE